MWLGRLVLCLSKGSKRRDGEQGVKKGEDNPRENPQGQQGDVAWEPPIHLVTLWHVTNALLTYLLTRSTEQKKIKI